MAEKKICQMEKNNHESNVEMKQQLCGGDEEHESNDKDVVTCDKEKVRNDKEFDQEVEKMEEDVGEETLQKPDENLCRGNGDDKSRKMESSAGGGGGVSLNCEDKRKKSRNSEAKCMASGDIDEQEQNMEDDGEKENQSEKKNGGRGDEVGAQGDGIRGGEEDDRDRGPVEAPDEVSASRDRDKIIKRQRRILRNLMLSTEDDDDDDDDDDDFDDDDGGGDDDGVEGAEKEDEDEDTASEDHLLGKPYPKPSWHPVLAHAKRQCGGYKTPWAFSHQAMGNCGLVQRFEQYCALDSHEGCVNTLHFNQSGERLASGSDDLKIAIWDWAKKVPVLVYDSGHKRNVFQAKFMPNSGDTTLVSCARDGQVRVSELSSTGVCKATKRVAQHKAPAHKLALELASPVIFMSCGEDAVVWNIDLRESKPLKILTVKHEEKKVPLYTIHINPSNVNEFAVGGRDKYVRIYDRRKVSADESEPPIKKYCPHHLMSDDNNVNVTCSVYTYDGQELLVSYNDDEIYLFDNTHSDGCDYIHQYKGHRNNATVKGVNFYGARSEYVVSGSDCGNVFLWSKDTERIVQLMHGDDGGVVNCLEPHPTAPILATSGLDHDVKIWMPTAQGPVDIKNHRKVLKKNRLEREEEKNREPSQLESQMFMFLLQHLRRSNRRQAREEEDDLDSDDDSSSDSDDEDEDEDYDLAHQVACAPS